MAATTKAATLSIQKEADYKALRTCAQTCVDRDNNNNDLEGHFECGDKQILDSCFCRADLRPKATTFLSSCVITKCKYNTQDLSSVLQVYDGYCDFKPLTTSSSSTKKTSSTTKTTSSSSTKSKTTTATPAPSATVLSATSSMESSFASSTLSSTTTEALPTSTPEGAVAPTAQAMTPGSIAGIAIGGVAALFLAMAILMWFCRRGQKDEEHDPYFGRVQKLGHEDVGGGMQKHPIRQFHDPDAAYVSGGMYKGGFGEEERGRPRARAESFDMQAIPVRPTDFTTTTVAAPAPSPRQVYPIARKPVPVEICDTGFRAELDAGADGVGMGQRGEKG